MSFRFDDSVMNDIQKCHVQENESNIVMPIPIEIMYHDSEMTKLERIENGDWIDLRSAEDLEMKAGDFKLISLGISMKFPEEYEAHLVPRSSTFKNFGIIQTNSMGIVDHTYCGENDIWMMPALAMRDTVIHKNDRICQFRIEKRMEKGVYLKPVEHLSGKNRGGCGSTGKSEFVEQFTVSDNLVSIDLHSFERDNIAEINAYMIRCESNKMPAIVIAKTLRYEYETNKKDEKYEEVGVLKYVVGHADTYCCMVELNSYGKELYNKMLKPIIITDIDRVTDAFIHKGDTFKQVVAVYMIEGILYR